MNSEVNKPPINKKMLGERLLEAGLVNEFQLSLGLSEQKRTQALLGDVLEKLGFVTQESISRLLANESQTQFIDLSNLQVDSEVLKRIPIDIAKKYRLIPIRVENDILHVAMADTFDVVAIDALEQLTNSRIEVVAAGQQEIFEAIEQKYAQVESIEEIVEQALKAVVKDEDDDTQAVPIVRLVNRTILNAVRKRATDIHFEPESTSLRVRYRIDGVLYQEILLPKVIQSTVEARLKVMAKLDVTEHRQPLDGRIHFKIGKKSIDLRVSTLPTQFGQSVVLRILDKSSLSLDIETLGFNSKFKEKILKGINRPHGIILVTGPTGSGKTTTLYSSLLAMDTTQKSIFTLEDPIEYQLSHIRQTQVNPEFGLSFSDGLRSLLRQDPDVLLVGEIRDEETAQLATRAALTGHLVLSTLHTNSAIGAIPRLINMGVEPYLIASALQLIIAQRLVRRNCPHCMEDDDKEEVEKIFKQFDRTINPEATYKKSSGCERCLNTGFLGRVAIYEMIDTEDGVFRMIKPGIGESDLFKKTRAMQISTLVDNGVERAEEGIINVKELFRVVQ